MALVQLNIAIDKNVKDRLDALAKEPYRWTKRQAVTAAVEALDVSMRQFEAIAASADPPELGALIRRLMQEAPVELMGKQIGWGPLSDGRPALLVGEWAIAEDRNGDLLAIRRDGTAAGGIVKGRIQPLADVKLEGEEVVLHPAPSEMALT